MLDRSNLNIRLKCWLIDEILTHWCVKQILTTETINLPPPPENLLVMPEKCGRSIRVEWYSPFTELDLQLSSTSDKMEHYIRVTSYFPPHSHVFDGLKSNTVYEVRIRARNSYGFSLWAKKQMRTIAGIGMCYHPWLLPFSFYWLLLPFRLFEL